jgi:hypothetical protein
MRNESEVKQNTRKQCRKKTSQSPNPAAEDGRGTSGGIMPNKGALLPNPCLGYKFRQIGYRRDS